MAKNANIRFENANVAYVNVDTDTHELTGGVMDETTGIFYPVGGGGGGLSIDPPVLTLTLTDDSTTLTQPNIRNGKFYKTIPHSETGDVLIVEDHGYYYIELGEASTAILSDNINCTMTENEGYYTIDIIDVTQNASATLKYDGGMS